MAKRAAEQRQAKLDAIQELIKAGSLTVRQMTAEERAVNQARPRAQRTPSRSRAR